MRRALRFLLACVLAFTAGSALGVAYDGTAAHADDSAVSLPSVESQTLPDALSACFHAYGIGSDTPDAFVYADCVNAAYAHFLGRGWHSKLWNV